ncbi:Ankyrin-1 [Emericellopsis cladophorae]|uniref:Ankyrin-1 n=1 Tax=Emericellopsis cladophorae TaxID=2686198 RepID=A0A9P9XY04_9HYPO|nr:Ankyrin-1 [Emericellopsis cladophorae]KAI6779949.1 Ankyrin-1 [Emericellopsis cladophorae]
MSVVGDLQSTPPDSRSAKNDRAACRVHSGTDAAVRSPSAKRQKTLYEQHDKTGALNHEHYTIAWICALHIEMAAAIAVLDKKHRELLKPANDKNSYVLGSIRDHNIVIAGLPSNEYGLINAAHVLADLLRTFPSIRQGLMVGVGGGVPSKMDVRLGDVVVGTRVMNIDLGKARTGGKIQRAAVPKMPGASLCRAITKLRASHEAEPVNVAAVALERMKNLPDYQHPGTPDQLFLADYVHVSPGPDCDECDQSMLKVRNTRPSQEPRIHYGGIASSNQLTTDAIRRDELAQEFDILCFEMEAAGLMDVLACLPIRGICDYSDSHKSKEWQRYAAANAAAYARCLLQNLTAIEMKTGPPNSTHRPVPVDTDMNADHRRRLLESLRFQQMHSRKFDIRENDEQTCHWFLDSPVYQDWLDHGKRPSHLGLLWIRGKPGAGKSTLMKFLYSMSKKRDQSDKILTIAFFFHARGDTLEKTVSGMYRSLLLQILQGFPHLQHILDNTELVPRDEKCCPPVNALKELIRDAVVSLEEENLTFFVDALDECDEQQMTDMLEFLEDVAQRCLARNTFLLVCFSSRHYPYIDIRNGIRVILENQPGHTADLNKYIDNRLWIQDPALKNELKSVMLEKAAGVFLWVFLVVRILNKEGGGGGLRLRKKLEEVPTGLSELFRKLLTRDQENMEELRLSIMWILYAQRPLRPEEFYHAMWAGLLLESKGDPEMPNVNAPGAATRFNGCVISYTKGLAEITKDKENPAVQFIHESVRDFLARDDGLLSIWPELGADLEARSHDRLKSCCLSYFRHQEVRVTLEGTTLNLLTRKDRLQHESRVRGACPFLEYAVDSVLYHANAASDLAPQGPFMDDFPVQCWISCSDICHGFRGRQYSTDADLLYILVKQRYPALVRVRLEDHPNIAVSQRSGDFPVTAAAANKDKEIMDDAQRTALSEAALSGTELSVRDLLDAGSDIESKDRGGCTPLSLAVTTGNECAVPARYGYDQIVLLLLEHGANIEWQNCEGDTPLMLAFKTMMMAMGSECCHTSRILQAAPEIHDWAP